MLYSEIRTQNLNFNRCSELAGNGEVQGNSLYLFRSFRQWRKAPEEARLRSVDSGLGLPPVGRQGNERSSE